ncbi:hypothetical protein B0H11DRAFT_2222457 [Mycena galericulata]|nr:hypothetical protein B0H11DRAFT_2222457 [Mycena galericulata]
MGRSDISCASSKVRLRAGDTAASVLEMSSNCETAASALETSLSVAASRGETSSSGGFARVKPQRVPLRRAQTERGDDFERRLRAGKTAASALETSSSCETGAMGALGTNSSGGFARGDELERRLRAGETAAIALETNSSSKTAASFYAQGWDRMEPRFSLSYGSTGPEPGRFGHNYNTVAWDRVHLAPARCSTSRGGGVAQSRDIIEARHAAPKGRLGPTPISAKLTGSEEYDALKSRASLGEVETDADARRVGREPAHKRTEESQRSDPRKARVGNNESRDEHAVRCGRLLILLVLPLIVAGCRGELGRANSHSLSSTAKVDGTGGVCDSSVPCGSSPSASLESATTAYSMPSLGCSSAASSATAAARMPAGRRPRLRAKLSTLGSARGREWIDKIREEEASQRWNWKMGRKEEVEQARRARRLVILPLDPIRHGEWRENYDPSNDLTSNAGRASTGARHLAADGNSTWCPIRGWSDMSGALPVDGVAQALSTQNPLACIIARAFSPIQTLRDAIFFGLVVNSELLLGSLRLQVLLEGVRREFATSSECDFL